MVASAAARRLAGPAVGGLGRVDSSSDDVTSLDPARTGPSVLAQKVHGLSAATIDAPAHRGRA